MDETYKLLFFCIFLVGVRKESAIVNTSGWNVPCGVSQEGLVIFTKRCKVRLHP